jgi:hypothetical protein
LSTCGAQHHGARRESPPGCVQEKQKVKECRCHRRSRTPASGPPRPRLCSSAPAPTRVRRRRRSPSVALGRVDVLRPRVELRADVEP